MQQAKASNEIDVLYSFLVNNDPTVDQIFNVVLEDDAFKMILIRQGDFSASALLSKCGSHLAFLSAIYHGSSHGHSKSSKSVIRAASECPTIGTVLIAPGANSALSNETRGDIIAPD